MLRLLYLARPFTTLQRFGSPHGLRPLSTIPTLSPALATIAPQKRYYITPIESLEIDRLLLLVKAKTFDSLFASLKSTPSLNTIIFSRILQHKFGVSPAREIAVKEKIVEILEKRGLVLDAGSIVPLISLFGRTLNVKKADAMVEKMKENGIEATLVFYNALIKCFERDISRAEGFLNEMISSGIEPNVITFNTMIQAYSLTGNLEKVEELYLRMIADGIVRNQITYNTMLNAYSKGEKLDKSVELFDQIISDGFKPNSLVYNTMISIYGRSKSFEKADGILKKMKDLGIERSAPIYNSLIKCHEHDLLRVDSLFQEMIAEKIQPTVITFNSMIHAYSAGGNLDKAVELFDRMTKDGIKPNLITYNSIIHCYTKVGKLNEAEELFKRMSKEGIQPNLYLYNSMISGEAKFGNLEMVEKLFCRMIKDGIKPNDSVYWSLQIAYESLNDEKAESFFQS